MYCAKIEYREECMRMRLFQVVRCAMGHQLWVLARKGHLIEHFAFSAGDKTRKSIDASDKTVAIAGNSEPRIRPELGGLCIWRYLGRTLETHHSWNRNTCTMYSI